MRVQRSVGLLTIAIAMTLVGCGGGETSGSSSGGSGGSGGASTTSSGGSDTTSSGGGGAGGSVDGSLFAGVDVSGVPYGTAPQGCVGQFDPGKGELALSFGQGVTTVMVGVVAGKIQANGVNCTASDGAPATPESVGSVSITGTAADEIAILDLATGPFGGRIFGDGGGVHASLGGGTDGFQIRGTLGDDTLSAGMLGEEVAFDPSNRGAADVHVEGAEWISLSFGPGKDTFRGTGIAGGPAATADLLVFGDDGDDSLEGGAGDDSLFGGAGDDTFLTASLPDGADLYDGGQGTDTLDYSARTAALWITLGVGADDGDPGEKDDVTDTIERLFCGAGDDVITGSQADEEIHGGKGNDQIHGGPGDDAINGEDGEDELFGDDGDDNLFGDAGVDHLDGGAGSDVLDGGEGADKYDGGDGDGDVCLVDASEEPTSCELF